VDTRVGASADNLEIASANSGKGVAYDTCPWSTLRRSLGLVATRPRRKMTPILFMTIGATAPLQLPHSAAAEVNINVMPTRQYFRVAAKLTCSFDSSRIVDHGDAHLVVHCESEPNL
jgi:hypothetical protein